jgi:hypothetical protein
MATNTEANDDETFRNGGSHLHKRSSQSVLLGDTVPDGWFVDPAHEVDDEDYPQETFIQTRGQGRTGLTVSVGSMLAKDGWFVNVGRGQAYALIPSTEQTFETREAAVRCARAYMANIDCVADVDTWSGVSFDDLSVGDELFMDGRCLCVIDLGEEVTDDDGEHIRLRVSSRETTVYTRLDIESMLNLSDVVYRTYAAETGGDVR